MAIKMLNEIDFSINKGELGYLGYEADNFLIALKKAIKRGKIKATPFIGGSFAKETMVESDNYDIDIFVRFDKRYSEDEISLLLEKMAANLKVNFNKLHGSRDYIQVERSKKLTFEIIPVFKVANPKEAKNTTDLSYFHVNYVKKKIMKNKRLIREIGLAKKFFKATRVYGAESYISGFSGYAVECLIIYYKTFEKMIRAFLSAKGKIMIDPENYYKKENLMIEINESKTHSPIILVDPTFKERNVLAALSEESFERTKEAIRRFLARPSAIYFETKPINESDLIKKAIHSKAEYIKIILSTDKQEGDIAGTKLKKFSKYLISEIKEYFDLIEDEFDYKMTKEASLYLIVKSKKEIIKQGPPIRKDMQKHIEAFKKQNKKHFAKNGSLYAKIKIDFSAKDFISDFVKNNKKKIAEMDISSLKVI